MTDHGGKPPHDPFGMVPPPVTGVDFIAGQVTAPMRRPLLMILLDTIEKTCAGIERIMGEDRDDQIKEQAVRSMKAMLQVFCRMLREADLEEHEIVLIIRRIHDECLHKRVRDMETQKPYLMERNGFLKFGINPIFKKVVEDLNARLPEGRRITF